MRKNQMCTGGRGECLLLRSVWGACRLPALRQVAGVKCSVPTAALTLLLTPCLGPAPEGRGPSDFGSATGLINVGNGDKSIRGVQLWERKKTWGKSAEGKKGYSLSQKLAMLQDLKSGVGGTTLRTTSAAEKRGKRKELRKKTAAA